MSMALTQITPPQNLRPGADQAEQSSDMVCKEKMSPHKSRLFLQGEVFNGSFLWQLLLTEQYQRNVVENVRQDLAGWVQKHWQEHR